MEYSLLSLVAYFLLALPYFVNMAFVCFFFLLVQFLVDSQDALNSYARAAMDITSALSALQCFEKIAKLQSVLFSLKNELLSTLSLQIFLLMFHYVTETVSHVSSISEECSKKLSNIFFQLYFVFGLLFTIQNNSSFDIGITSNTVCELLSVAMYLVILMILPGENLEQGAREMLKILIEIDESTIIPNNMRAVSFGSDFNESIGMMIWAFRKTCFSFNFNISP